MNTFIHNGTLLHLIDSCGRLIEAGIDPAFDNDFDELERQFAELRIATSFN